MKKLIVQCTNCVRYFNNVTKIECFNAFEFESYMDVYEGKSKTRIKMYDIVGFEISE